MINNIALSIFGLNIYWYGIVYVLGFLFSYYFVLKFAKVFGFQKDLIEDILLWTMFVSVLFGRLFHIIFYDPVFYLNHLSQIIRFDRGGMSIHGGFFGSVLVFYIYSKKYNLNILKLTDLFAMPTAFVLSIGRIANFINQELVGRITSNSFFGVVFPKYDNNLRWPTTLFESFKNMFVFQFLIYFNFIKSSYKKTGFITGWFLVLYNFLRFFIDFLREPDVFIYFISMGQILSLIYGFIGIWILYKFVYKK